MNHDDADADGVAGCPDARVPDDATRGIRVSHGWWSREREEETDDDDAETKTKTTTTTTTNTTGGWNTERKARGTRG